ncbi:MAG: RHS repeat-associated core domain-containing protein [Lachnospiraceae bacterium]|nr:RHS repeat-associated core domain-containing protein [Lachnospiraceae bacterium]
MPVRRHLSGLGLSHVQTLNDGIYHACHQDEQGSTAYITGNGGAVENCYDYDAFGNVHEQKEGIENYIRYRGQQHDQEAGQYYLRARYYSPVIGRFTQEDTYRGDGLNLYAYCGNNPVMYYDPSGHNQITQPTVEPESPRSGGEGGLKSNNPLSYLQRALENQGLDTTPSRLKEVWIEDDYKYTVRVHEGNSKYTNADVIYRVSRQSTILDEHGQGTGLEYLGTDGNWYHESVLIEFFKGGTPNPNFNDVAAKMTHIPVGGGD